MKVHILRENRRLEVDFEGKVRELLEMLNINPETVLVVRKNKLMTEEDMLLKSEDIKILSVVSGG